MEYASHLSCKYSIYKIRGKQFSCIKLIILVLTIVEHKIIKNVIVVSVSNSFFEMMACVIKFQLARISIRLIKTN